MCLIIFRLVCKAAWGALYKQILPAHQKAWHSGGIAGFHIVFLDNNTIIYFNHLISTTGFLLPKHVNIHTTKNVMGS